MTLEQAVAILNRERHRDWGAWSIDANTPGKRYAVADDPWDELTEFEAIAIAKEYERLRASLDA